MPYKIRRGLLPLIRATSEAKSVAGGSSCDLALRASSMRRPSTHRGVAGIFLVGHVSRCSLGDEDARDKRLGGRHKRTRERCLFALGRRVHGCRHTRWRSSADGVPRRAMTVLTTKIKHLVVFDHDFEKLI